MIADLKPYPVMKDSGVEWQGNVPEHWEVRRLKTVCSMQSGDGITATSIESSGVYPVYGGNGRRGYTSNYTHDGTFVLIGRQGALCGNVHIASGRFWASEHTVVTTPKVGHFPEWLGATLDAMNLNQYSIAAAQPGLSVERVLDLQVPVPNAPEQAAIVRYLDHVDRRIQRYIRAKQKLIALLEEQKQALIHQAVTGQIDVRTGRPYPAYKDSGVEWLGKVPEHWEVVPLRRVAFDYCDGPFGSGLKSSHYTEEGVRVVRLQNIGHGEFRNSDAAFISPEYYSSLGDHSVEEGDILIAGLGDDNHPAGRACVAPASILPAMVKADCFRFRLNQTRVDPRFIALQLAATATVASALLSTGATRQRTNLQNTSARAISFPAVPEQVLIVEHIIVKTSGISAAVKSAKCEIELLREYRTRLIADVVTGKLDVSEAAGRLPDEREERPEPYGQAAGPESCGEADGPAREEDR